MREVGMRELLCSARSGGRAVAAINVSNWETASAVLAAADALDAPVILQVSPMQREVQGCGYRELAALLRLGAERFPRGRFCLHLDHCSTVEECLEAARAGFGSVMLDLSAAPLDENIRETARLRRLLPDCALEAELGRVGGEEGGGGRGSHFTDPGAAADFLARTGADFLAVSVGNAHGLYREPPRLRFDLLEEIARAAPVPLVLHGASGIPATDLRRAMGLGVAKINFFTTLDRAFCGGLREALEEGGMMMHAQRRGREEMCREAEKIIALCGGMEDKRC